MASNPYPFDLVLRRQLIQPRQHLASVHPAESRAILGRFEAFERAMAEMMVDAQTTFAAFQDGGASSAGRRMAAMDRRYAVVLSALLDLRREVRDVQQRLFAQQGDAARKLQRYELLIAGLIVLMVGGALVYGRRRIVVAVLFGFIFGALSRDFFVLRIRGVPLEFQTIGFVIPGLIANWMDKQGITQTLCIMVMTAVLVRLLLMLLSHGNIIQ